jgi:hypothetical protein
MKISGILKFTAIAVSAAIFFIACEKDDFVDDDSAIVSLSAVGVPTEKLIFTVNDNNLVLTAEDIKVNAKYFSVIKGKLTKKGTSYELAITAGGTDKIRIGLDPYRGFTGWNAKTVNVYADWYFNGTENLTITGYSSSVVDPSKIPAEIAEKPVTAIGYRAFYNKGLTSVSFSDGVRLKDIGASAFARNQLTEIIIPDSVKTMGDTSFAYNQLSKVVIPNEITDIGYGVFAYNQLTKITIPNSVTSIGNFAFGSNDLTEIKIPESVEILSGFNNNQLKTIEIPNTVTYIGESAFSYNKLTTITIPDDVTFIGNSAFSNNELTAVKIPDTVITIENYAFSHNKLNNVTLPKRNMFSEINSHAFSYNALTEITIPNNVTIIRNSAFENNKLTNVTIHDGIIYIDTWAFKDNPLTKIIIGENVTLGSSAFGNGFETAYYKNNRQKGTYTLTGGVWNYAP